VPDVVGDTQAAAVTALQGANLNPVVICQLTLDPTQDGIVQSQNPTGGVQVNSGTTVTITVTNLNGCSGTTTTSAPSGNTGQHRSAPFGGTGNGFTRR
jgi:beta-lactam-binding protein with PASTA domain